jgi:hypothetical protein
MAQTSSSSSPKFPNTSESRENTIGRRCTLNRLALVRKRPVAGVAGHGKEARRSRGGDRPEEVRSRSMS